MLGEGIMNGLRENNSVPGRLTRKITRRITRRVINVEGSQMLSSVFNLGFGTFREGVSKFA